MKRFLAALLTGAMLCVTLLAGCGGSTSSAPAASTGSGSAAAPTDPKDMPLVRMFYPLMSVPADNSLIEEKLNELTTSKVGVRVELETVPYASYNDQINLILAGTEQYDIAMVMGANLASYIAKDALVGLNDLLDAYGQDTKTALGNYLEAGAVDGEVYALSAIRNMAAQQGIALRKDLVEKYDIDLDAIKTEEDLTAVFEKVAAGEPDMYMVRPETSGNYGWLNCSLYDPLGDYIGMLGDQAQTLEVVNYPATEEYEKQCRLHRAWYQKGWVPNDLLTSSDSAWDLVAAGKLFGVTLTVKPGTAQEKTNSANGVELVTVTYGEPLSYTSKATGFSWAVLQNTADAEAAMKVLNLLFTDPDFVNLIDWGVEGVHYQHVDGYDNVITFADGVDAASSGYFHSWNFAFGNQLLSWVWQGDDPDLWDQMREFNDSAVISKAMGFTWDVTPVKTEFTAVNNVRTKYEMAITSGAMDYDETIDAYLKELEDAGIEKIIAEKQAQLDAWAAANGVS